MPWPEDERLLTDDDRFERLEKLILRCTKGKKKRGEGTGWNRFLGSLCFEQPLEFNEGDIGLAGGIAITEPASVNPTSVDRIKRYGGTTSSEKPWPEEPEAVTDEERPELQAGCGLAVD